MKYLLKCAHQVGRSRHEYLMECDVLKRMPDGRLKIRVYGDRFWKRDKQRIRYVESVRVISI